jgi:hypothetical protein
MAIKRWNASTSQWELVGTPGTATPSAIGAAGLVGGNTLTGRQTVSGGSGGIDIESTSLIRSKNGFRVTGNNGANEYQVGPFYNFTDFQITSSTNNFAAHTKRFEINTTGSSILGEAAASTYNPDSSFNRVLAVIGRQVLDRIHILTHLNQHQEPLRLIYFFKQEELIDFLLKETAMCRCQITG